MSAEEKVSDVFTGALLESLSRFELNVRILTSSGIRGEKRSKRKGSSIEYADHRQYAHGDDLRRLDWHALARLDQMLIRLYAAEEVLPLEVVIDTSASMGFGSPSKFVTAARVGACLTQIALLHGTPVRWRIAGDTLTEPLRLSGRNDIRRLFRVVDEVAPVGRGSLSETLRKSAQQGPRRRSLVVLTDGYDHAEMLPALRALRAAGTDVYLVLVLSPEETDPRQRGEFTYIDVETGIESVLSLDSSTLKEYQKALDNFRAAWMDICRRHGVAMVELSSAQPIDASLFRTLAEGGIIG